MEPFYPLHAFVCDECFLVQLEEYVSPTRSSPSTPTSRRIPTSWVEHARRYAEMMIARFGLGAQSQVVEIASNDGYLLQHFVAQPASRCSASSPRPTSPRSRVEKGIPTVVRFFGLDTARRIADETRPADLLLGNNVLAHVPDINDFVGGHEGPAAAARRDHDGVPASAAADGREPVRHDLSRALLLLLVPRRCEKIFAASRPDASSTSRRLPTHGGSLRIYARHARTPRCRVAERVHGAAPARDRRRLRSASSATRRFARAGEGNEAQAARVPDRGQARRARRSSATARPARATRCSTTAASAPTSSTTPSTRNPYKQGKFTPGHAHSDPAAGKRSARRGPTTC